MKLKIKLFIILIIILIVTSLAGATGYVRYAAQQSPPVPVISPTLQPPTPTDICRKKIESDNLLFEDRMQKAVKTCKDTQICTYEDFRMYSTSNGQYVPDWRSEAYMNLEVNKCLEKLSN